MINSLETSSPARLLELNLVKFKFALKEVKLKHLNEFFVKNFNELLSTLSLLIKRHSAEGEKVLLSELTQALNQLHTLVDVFKLDNLSKIGSLDELCNYLLSSLENFIAKKCSKKTTLFSKPKNPLLDIIRYVRDNYKQSSHFLESGNGPKSIQPFMIDAFFIMKDYEKSAKLISDYYVESENLKPIDAKMMSISHQFQTSLLNVCMGYIALNEGTKAETAKQINEAESTMTHFWDLSFKDGISHFSQEFMDMNNSFREIKVNFLVSMVKNVFPRKLDLQDLNHSMGSVMSIKNLLRELLDLKVGLELDKHLGIQNTHQQLANIEHEAKDFVTSDHHVRDKFILKILHELNELIRLPETQESSEQGLTTRDHRELLEFKIKLEKETQVSVDLKDDSVHYSKSLG